VPPRAWQRAAAAATATRLGSYSSLRELVLLLQAMAAAGCCYSSDSSDSSHSDTTGSGGCVDEAWWQAWFSASVRLCEGLVPRSSSWLLGLQQEAGAAPQAAAADWGTGGQWDAAADEEGAVGVDDAEQSSGGESEGDDQPHAQRHPQQQQQQQQPALPPHQALPAGLLCEALVVLLQRQRQVHPLWLAGMLEVMLLRCVLCVLVGCGAVRACLCCCGSAAWCFCV
jgi:hypothetical protein